jgi:hypothetical protein
MGSYFNVLSAAAVVATTFTATVSLAVEATKEASYSGKINLTGKVTDMVRSGSGLNNA